MGNFVVKGLITCGGITGLGCAVGVPLTYEVNSGDSPNLLGGGGYKTVSMEACSTGLNGDLNSIPFGERNSQNVCWTIEKDTVYSPIVIGKQQEYSNLFKEMWDQPTGNWNSNSKGNWKATCIKDNRGWAIQVSGDNKEYLGFCEQGSEEQNQPAVLIDGKNQKSVKVKLCQNNCFLSSGDTQSQVGIKTLSENNGNSWFEVKFFKK